MSEKNSLYILCFIIIISFSVILINNQNYEKNDVFGLWKGHNHKEVIYFKFNFDYSCDIRVIDETTKNENIYSGNFEINFLKKPKTLSIRNISQLDYPLHTIIEFLNKDLLKMGSFSPRWKLRPISFDPISSIIIKKISY